MKKQNVGYYIFVYLNVHEKYQILQIYIYIDSWIIYHIHDDNCNYEGGE